jgi:uncharacterized protein YndB with AHSA1/START domain/DNA-binding transcriptional ArsR family regulator
VDVALLAALAEPNRLRIVELLAEAPRTVGEVASALGLRQPQVTKHLQTLEHAGLVVVHPLGRRRVCALRRGAFDDLAGWAAKLTVPGSDDSALARYRAAVSSAGPAPVTVQRTVPASRSDVWSAFTDPVVAARWWHPRHFSVAAFGLDPRAGGAVELVLREGDGTTHHATGRVDGFDPPRRLAFTLDPLGPDGQPQFTAHHDVHLTTVEGGTKVDLVVTPADLHPGADAALGGLGVGWEQLLDNLAALAASGISAGPDAHRDH